MYSLFFVNIAGLTYYNKLTLSEKRADIFIYRLYLKCYVLTSIYLSSTFHCLYIEKMNNPRINIIH